MSSDKLQFIDYRKPKLEAGDYTFEVTQTYGDPKGSARTAIATPLKVKVSGDRIRLKPEQVFAQYPPAGEKGDFSDTLPHISLKKASLPWERSAYNYDSDNLYTKQSDIESFESWLYLMLINEEDISRGDVIAPRPMRVSQLKQDAYVPQRYDAALEEDVNFGLIGNEEEVQVVDVKKPFFEQLIAKRKQDLQYIAHVRRRYDSKQQLKRELSVIIANRFARHNKEEYPLGMANHALLVSLEGYLNDDAKTAEKSLYVTGDESAGVLLAGLPGDSYIRLVILTSWSFTSRQNKINFEQRSKALDVGSLRLPAEGSSPKHPFVKAVPTKRDSGKPFDSRLQAGMTAIPHQFRLGDRSFSWYRGPCAPFDNASAQLTDDEKGKHTETSSYIGTDADRLLAYCKEDGMFDISYAAAYELGRLLGIKNEDYAKALCRYKKANSRYIALQKSDANRHQDVIGRGITIADLPYAKLDDGELAKDYTAIKAYLTELAQLQDIPHWYLVPDPNLLPQRTIRTFQIDRKWIQSLWLGALSIGGRAKTTYYLYDEIDKDIELSKSIPKAGFFLRSDLVWAYPEMQVSTKAIHPNDGESLDLKKLRTDKGSGYAAYIDRGQWACKLMRQEGLAEDLLMGLTNKPFNYMSLALPAESLHYGADVKQMAATFKANKLNVAGEEFILSLVEKTESGNGVVLLKDGHIPTVSYDATSSKPSVSVVDKKLIISLGNRGVRTTVQELQQVLQQTDKVISNVAIIRESAQKKLLPVTYTKSIQYKGIIIGHPVDISNPDLVDDYGIVNMNGLAAKIKLALEQGLDVDVDKNYKEKLESTSFASAHLGRYMLEGEPKVEFSLGGHQ